MRAVFGLVLIAGIGLAGFAAYMVKERLDTYEAALAQARAAQGQIVDTVEVFVAKEQLTYGARLAKEAVRLVKWPKSALPEGVFTEAAALFPEDKDPRTILRTMEKNEPILAVKITEPGQDAGITSRLKRGMRAFAIKVDATSGVSGFLRPGDRVDVYWTGNVGRMTVGGEGRGEITKLIQTGVQLVAVDQSASDERPGATVARTVTVAVRPDQVAALAQAQSTGKLSLALVGAGDDSVSSSIEMDQQMLLGLTRAREPEPVEKKEECTIRTRRGSEVVEIPIPCTN
jgi:pilus assembly protein CpaB